MAIAAHRERDEEDMKASGVTEYAPALLATYDIGAYGHGRVVQYVLYVLRRDPMSSDVLNVVIIPIELDPGCHENRSGLKER